MNLPSLKRNQFIERVIGLHSSQLVLRFSMVEQSDELMCVFTDIICKTYADTAIYFIYGRYCIYIVTNDIFVYSWCFVFTLFITNIFRDLFCATPVAATKATTDTWPSDAAKSLLVRMVTQISSFCFMKINLKISSAKLGHFIRPQCFDPHTGYTMRFYEYCWLHKKRYRLIEK